MCEFQSLYFDEDGYVVRCKQCGHYQVAFISTMLTLTETDFHEFCKLVKNKWYNSDESSPDCSKAVILKTPAQGVFIMLTRSEAGRFCEILEQADSEARALTMINLFNP
ncbi:MAG: DUF6686 family protein [Ferruginibacter sp.]